MPILVKWPERVPEQTRRIILLLERHKTLPIFAKGGSHTCGDLVPSEELCVAPLHLRTLTLHHEELPYRREGPTARHRLDCFSEPLCHRWREKENSVSWSAGHVKRWRRSYVFGASNAARVVDSHFPLVQGCDGKCGLALCLWNARPFIIDDGTTREFKEPS